MKLSVVLRQTEAEIIDVLNNSELPLDIMDMLLIKIGNIVHAQAEEQYKKDIESKEDK